MKFTEKQKEEIGNAYISGLSTRVVAEKYGTT